MIETLQIILNAPIGLQVIVLGGLTFFAFHYYKEKYDKKN